MFPSGVEVRQRVLARIRTPSVLLNRTLKELGLLDDLRALVRGAPRSAVTPPTSFLELQGASLRSKLAKAIDYPGVHGRARTLLDGVEITVDPGEVVGRSLLFGLPFEAGELRVFSTLLSPGNVFLDVGANCGMYSIIANNRLGPGGRIFAFEPNPTVRELLTANLRKRDQGPAITILSTAIGNSVGEVTFSCSDDSAYSGLGHTGRSEVAATIRVASSTLDHFVREQALPRVDVMKVDVEGFEAEVLSGGSALLSAPNAPAIMIEVADENLAGRGSSESAVLGQLRSFGYEILAITRHGSLVEAASASKLGHHDFLALKPPRRSRVQALLENGSPRAD